MDMKTIFMNFLLRYPIVQTYVDVFLAGCIEIEETYNLTGYKDACITSTQGIVHENYAG